MFTGRIWTWVRVAVLLSVLAYVVTVIRSPQVGDAVGGAAIDMLGIGPEREPEWVALPRPVGWDPKAGGGDAADVLRLLGELGPECPLHGVSVRLKLGSSGLESVVAKGAPNCAAEALWTPAWPAIPAGFEVETVIP